MWAYGLEHHEKRARRVDKWANPRSHGFDRARKARARREAREEIVQQLLDELAWSHGFGYSIFIGYFRDDI